jgi:hypothetical protein
MENNFSEMNFEQHNPLIPGWVFGVAFIIVLFGVLWVILPLQAMFWVMLVFVTILSTCAIHGWRQALVAIGMLFRTDK